MPDIQNEDSEQRETSKTNKQSISNLPSVRQPAEEKPTTGAVPRRRGGRRVVRGAGAAGAVMALKVEKTAVADNHVNGGQETTAQTEQGSQTAAKGRAPKSGGRSSVTTRKKGGKTTSGAHKKESDATSTKEEMSSPDSESGPTQTVQGNKAMTRRNRRSTSTQVDAASPTDTSIKPNQVEISPDSDVNADSQGNKSEKTRPMSKRGQTRTRKVTQDSEGGVSVAKSSRGRAKSAKPNAEDTEAEVGGARESSDRNSVDLPSGMPTRHMTSLLFQEPVIPVIHESRGGTASSQTQGDDEASEPRKGRRRSSTGHRSNKGADTHGQNYFGEDEGHDSVSDIRRNGDKDRKDRKEREEDFAGNVREESKTAASGRSRRLNAQERQAADEVEQIEEDLQSENISYTPIDQDEPEEQTRTRRRHRTREDQSGKGSGDDAKPQTDEDGPASSHRRSDEDEQFSSITRRRRRRRSTGTDIAESTTISRSRKQQYIDEITDVTGSTRLEAKKQRRRDNRRERSRQSQLMEQDFLARRENVNRMMVVRERERHTQISVIEDDILVEHYVSDIQEVATVGNVYLGRVQNVLPSMEAAFVDIGQARNGVLYAGEVNWDTTRLEGQPRRIELAFKSGDPVLVQVTKDPIGHKGARLTSQVTLAGRFLVLVPSGGMTGVSRKLSEQERGRLKAIVARIAPKSMGVIIRTAAEGASEESLKRDLENLRRQWDAIESKREEFLHGKRPKLLQGEPDVAIRVVRDIFNDDFSKMIVEGDTVNQRIENYLEATAPDLREKMKKWDPAEHEGKDVFDRWQIDSQLRKGMERQVFLPSGGSIVIDRTEAMTTIDVNTGRFIGKGKSLEDTVTRCNLEASEEIARQLRLRDIGGMVMIDYVDMVMPANRDLVLRRLVECLARDRTKHQVAEVTSLGLVQMTRKRVGQGLVEAFSEECPTCKGRGFIVHDEPTISSSFSDPYALKGGDPFIKTNKHSHGAAEAKVTKGSSPDVKAKLAQIAAAAVAATDADDEGDEGDSHGQPDHWVERRKGSQEEESMVSKAEPIAG